MDEDLLRQIQDINKNLRPLFEAAVEQMRPLITVMTEMQKKYTPIIHQVSEKYGVWIRDKSHLFEQAANFIRQAEEWQENQKQNVIVMAQRGWFPNWFTFYYRPRREVTDLDELMTLHLNHSWEEIVSYIIARCPKRKHIMEAAFALHKSRNFIASVPLFIAQADGIFCEEIKTFLFAGDKPKDVLDHMIDRGELQKGFFEDILLEPYRVKTQFSEGVKKCSKGHKAKAPNRNGILHGHKKHLDYGTELNSLKSFSLLAFVVFSTKDVFKKGITTGKIVTKPIK